MLWVRCWGGLSLYFGFLWWLFCFLGIWDFGVCSGVFICFTRIVYCDLARLPKLTGLGAMIVAGYTCGWGFCGILGLWWLFLFSGVEALWWFGFGRTVGF